MTLSSGERSSERGFSLVELAVYILVLGIISTIIVTVVIALFRSEQTVSAVTNSSNDSQIISTRLSDDIRNARAFRVTPNAVTASVAGSGVTPTWSCVRWIVTGPNNELFRQSVTQGASVPSWPTGTRMATGMKMLSGTPYFSGGGPAVEAGQVTGSLTYSLGVPSVGNNVMSVVGEASNRAAAAGARCW